jgi:REP element-mobilizing transposase RayT
MEAYKRGSHTVWDCKYHLVWVTKYRYPVLGGMLRKRYWGQHLWARGYWVTSSGNVTDEVWAEYINNQTPPEPDDDFNVT